MARNRREDQLEMNFDWLNDSLTNLVGNLILIVILLYAITTEVTKREPPQFVSAPPVEQPQTPKRAGTKKVDDLLLELERLQADISQIDREMSELKRQVPELQTRAENVLQKVGSAD